MISPSCPQAEPLRAGIHYLERAGPALASLAKVMRWVRANLGIDRRLAFFGLAHLVNRFGQVLFLGDLEGDGLTFNQIRIWIHDAGAEMKLKVGMGHPTFGIPRIADESDLVTGRDTISLFEFAGDRQCPVGPAIVATGIVIVEMQVPALPTVGMIDDHVPACPGALPDPVDGSISDGEDRCHLRRHQVDAHVDAAVRLDQAKGLKEPGVDRILRKDDLQRWSPRSSNRHPRNRKDGCGTSRSEQAQELPPAQTRFWQ